MRCFRHFEREAVGVCKHCQRGLCTECAVEVDGVLACRDLHEGRVAALNRLVDTELVQSQRVRSGFVRNGIFYALVGVVFAGLGISQLRYLGFQAVFFIVVGALLLYVALANFLEGRRFG